MQRPSVYGLKAEKEAAQGDETEPCARKPLCRTLVLVKAEAKELLDKEAACCSLATD